MFTLIKYKRGPLLSAFLQLLPAVSAGWDLLGSLSLKHMGRVSTSRAAGNTFHPRGSRVSPILLYEHLCGGLILSFHSK